MAEISRFHMAFAKWQWGNHHLAALNGVVEPYLDADPWTLESVDTENGRRTKFVLNHTPPHEISFMLGDVIANLRTALDYAAYSLVEFDSPEAPLGRVYFPYGRLGQRLNAKDRTQVKAISDNSLAILEAARHLYGRELLLLQTLSNQDKHRLIVPTVYKQMPMKVEFDNANGTADFVPDLETISQVWNRDLSDGDLLEETIIYHFKLGMVIDGWDNAPELGSINGVNWAVQKTLEMISSRFV